jgi:sugar lactone lactonase YvrE
MRYAMKDSVRRAERSEVHVGARRLACALAIGVATFGAVRAGNADFDPFARPPVFALDGASPGGGSLARGSPAYLMGSRIAAVDDGALAIDADSGMLVRVDANGASVAQLSIARDAGVLVYDSVARVAYVADRRGDRIVAVRVGRGLEVAAAWRTPAEPYGVALTPDRTTVLVTHVADRLLVAYDTANGHERWRAALAAEPRGLAVSPDGTRALVTYPGAGVIDELALADRTSTHLALPRRTAGHQARGGSAVAFLGDELAIAPFQRERPDNGTEGGTYGGSRESPVTYHLALLGFAGRRRAVAADIDISLPRAIAWDATRDALYVAGLGTDEIVQIVNASQVDPRARVVGSAGGKERCGADGLAIAGDGNVLVWCSFTRSVARVVAIDGKGKLAARWLMTRGPELAASALDVTQHLGMVLFHTANMHISLFTGLACASCHHEGRADGLSWRIDDRLLQTPILAGRIPDTAPYGWDGHAKNLSASLRSTFRRLNGFGGGLGKRDSAALAAYLEAMPAVRRPNRNADAVARGQALFEALGCRGCHDGAAYTDQVRHRLSPSQAAVDTPSLLGLSASAPYFHDGSAATLDVLLRDRGAVHGMSDAARTLTDRETSDLTAFLESL